MLADDDEILCRVHREVRNGKGQLMRLGRDYRGIEIWILRTGKGNEADRYWLYVACQSSSESSSKAADRAMLLTHPPIVRIRILITHEEDPFL